MERAICGHIFEEEGVVCEEIFGNSRNRRLSAGARVTVTAKALGENGRKRPSLQHGRLKITKSLGFEGKQCPTVVTLYGRK